MAHDLHHKAAIAIARQAVCQLHKDRVGITQWEIFTSAFWPGFWVCEGLGCGRQARRSRQHTGAATPSFPRVLLLLLVAVQT